MPPFAEKYTQEQREALAEAFVDRGIMAPQIVRLAEAGELSYRGKVLEPFEANVQYTRDLGAKLRRRRSGKIEGEIAKKAPRDAIEALRRRLVAAADQELAAWERLKPGTRDLERFRQIIRCVREASSLPGPKDPRPPKPGAKEPGGGDASRDGAETTGGLAGQILKAAGQGRVQVRNGESPH